MPYAMTTIQESALVVQFLASALVLLYLALTDLKRLEHALNQVNNMKYCTYCMPLICIHRTWMLLWSLCSVTCVLVM